MAWILVGIVLLYDAALLALGRTLGVFPIGLTAFLLLAGLLILFGNRVEARTEIRVDETGVRYDSGLRKSNIGWPEVREVQVQPMRSGFSVQVTGTASHFRFTFVPPVVAKGPRGNRPGMGFPDAAQLAVTIIRRAGLELAHSSEQGRIYRRGVREEKDAVPNA